MRVLKRFLVFASLLGVALFAVTLSTMAPATAFAEPGISPARIKSEQVVDTYYHYMASRFVWMRFGHGLHLSEYLYNLLEKPQHSPGRPLALDGRLLH